MAPQPPPPPPELPLQKHLRRMLEALAEGQKRHAQWKERWERQHAEEMERWAQRHSEGVEKWAERQSEAVEKWAERHAKGVEKWAQGVEKWAEQMGSMSERMAKKERRKWERRMAREQLKEQQRAARRQRELEEANPLMGWVFALAALVMAGMAVLNVHTLWWLIFVALGMGSAAAGILGRARQHQLQAGQKQGLGTGEEAREEAPERPVEPEAPRQAEDPRTARVDALCDKLLAELRAGPGVLREVVHQPEQTVEGLRKSCHELARRERELRALSPPEEERRLEEERARLAARVESERDGVVKERLESALRLLDEQRKQRAELATAASRLEAEHMRLYYTLENLYTQVLRVRSADAAGADVAGAGLRRSVEQLGLEMDAVAEALEEVHRDAPPRERVPTR
ncbi:hypothetical protein ATI61_104659 [Archangium gephyra]|uniref:Uncharacterized protein n=1 Tax=Archangium gephyra TaxID=48 RepID=A0AAC8Q2V1_9BACT|nr:hypothetical protein [Archangium gephyra]AKI99920.1 Hypothetical protein AA314_01547 [Archangium gephyra]REG33368.1 hypothetical protein ATI61_104659 [Archangium gephyra]